MLIFPSAPNHPAANYWSRLDKPRKSTFFFRGKDSTNCFFSNLSSRFQYVTSPTFLSGVFILTSLNDTSSPRACAWTPARMLHLTNPCAKWKVLSLTKPKIKIYKTKSLGNYITPILGYTRGRFKIMMDFSMVMKGLVWNWMLATSKSVIEPFASVEVSVKINRRDYSSLTNKKFYIRSVRTQDVVWKTCRKQWMIGTDKRKS